MNVLMGLCILGAPLVLSGDPVRIMVDNHEEEIRAFEERLINQETIMDSLRNNMQELMSQQKSQFNTSLGGQEKQVKQLQDKVSELEKKLVTQSQQINLLQEALKTFIDSFNTVSAPEVETRATKVYVVKNGDSLGKIARAHHTSTHVLRELNQLSGDKIIVGQKLKVPE